MRRKVPDTWWGAVVVGVLAGGAGGVVWAVMTSAMDSESLPRLLLVALPTAMVGVVMLSLLKHHDNVRRAERSTEFPDTNSREAAFANPPWSGASLVEPCRGV
jgi:hypothetical protein